MFTVLDTLIEIILNLNTIYNNNNDDDKNNNNNNNNNNHNNNLSLRKFLLPLHNYFLLDPKLVIGTSVLFSV